MWHDILNFMLEMYPSADAAFNSELSKTLFLRKPLTGVSFVLTAEGKTVGLMELRLPPNGNGILSVGILPEFRGKGYGDFFTRAALLRLSETGEEIRIAYASEYYLKFGFRQCGKEMILKSKDLYFPHECGAHTK